MKVTVDTVVERLTRKILAGQLRPGQQLQELTMASALGVSRNTLREAFRILAYEGLLEYYPHRGVFVKTMRVADVGDLYRFRLLVQGAVLESMALGEVDQDALDEALFSMRHSVDAANQALSANDWQTVGNANYAFHQALVDAAGSPRLSASTRAILAQTRLAFLSARSLENLHKPYVEENAHLLHLIEDRNYEQATVLLREYLASAKQRLIDELA